MKQRRLKRAERNRGGGETCFQASHGLQCQLFGASLWVTGLWWSLHLFSSELLVEQYVRKGLLHQEWEKGGWEVRGERGNEKEKKRRKKGCNITFILEGRIQLLAHCNAVSVALETIGNHLFLSFPSPYPLNCIYLHFFCLHLWLMAGAGWKTSEWCLAG